MDPKKIGGFLKELRKEKGLTQEQLAEILGVSGRTISRWETGSNMPDLSILIQIADYYDVEIKEILDGERKSEIMEKEMKETLCKVADYSKLEKEKAEKAANVAFGVIFAACVVMIIIQLIVTGDLSSVLGETVALVIGGVVYIGIMVHYGIWETGSRLKSTPLRDSFISVGCSAVFSVVFGLYMLNHGASESRAAGATILFFVGITILGLAVLRILALFSSKKAKNIHRLL